MIFSDPIKKNYYPCQEVESCADPNGKITFSYNGWTPKYKLYCDKMDERILGRTFYFVFNSLGCVVMLGIVDAFGRKNTLIAASLVALLGMFSSVVVDNWLFRMAAIGLANGSQLCFSNLCNMLMNETSRKRKK